MADFNTNHYEELLINRVRKDGFGYDEESEFPKYFVLRIALAWAMNAPHLPLESVDWKHKRLEGERGKEYHLEQITGKGKDKKEDFDLLIRSMLYIKHKEELDRDKKDIFSDDKEYLRILSRYIQRGLYELDNTYKSRDCFYQWCWDNLHLSLKQEEQTKENPKNNEVGYFPKLQDYFKKQGIGIRLINEEDSYRHHICKIELLDSIKIQAFKTKSQYLDDELGANIYIEQVKGISKTYSIQIPKPKGQRRTLGLSEFKQGLEVLRKQNFELGVFAGMSVDKKPFCFDLKTTPHLLVAGQTGGGKSMLLKNIILCLLRHQNVEIFIIDPKAGASFAEFTQIKNLEILGTDKSGDIIESFVSEMESRYVRKSKGESFESMPYRVLIIDELNDLIRQNKDIETHLIRLAEKAREARIHLVLATQRPDSATLSGSLRSNVPSRIALKVQKSTESKIILDEVGAEKLTGNGDMLIKLGDSSSLQRIIGIYLTEEEIQSQLKAVF
ncbi:DNA translocase FtsK [Helicobacter cholecystus]|uniref:DNA translocase FtsK n=1 Tax=Helicobacter cholecystus TaxID=45498 RepID=A0A3D8IVD4_9HELI|nr:FtsK/SpoIIIE domain-containing protein [Helicobacter cholecystus]RDU68936.1 DNA translocase FtsK [Helicobacter cholecystus]VEJ25934.1 cell division protein FtsK [Helicobacter cholecystus]